MNNTETPPLVAVVMGSKSDWETMRHADEILTRFGVPHESRIVSAHRTPALLAEFAATAESRGIEVILAGMEAPPNYGRDYIVSFHKVYPALATQYHVALVPFLLQGVAGIDTLNQRDGIHPTAAGARLVADNVWAVLKPIAERSRQPRHAPSTGSGPSPATSRGEGRARS